MAPETFNTAYHHPETQKKKKVKKCCNNAFNYNIYLFLDHIFCKILTLEMIY